MKKYNRIVALLLCAAMFLSLFGCSSAPAEPTPTEPPTEPPADLVYSNAVSALKALTNVTLELEVTTTTTVAGQVFSEQSTQILTYSGIGSDGMVIAMDESLLYNVHDEKNNGETVTPVKYSEVYSSGTLYTKFQNDYLFSAELSAEDAAARYLPVVLLDETLYGTLTSETFGGNTTISFAEPTAAESWAMPEGAGMLDAFGSATVDSNGAVDKMSYTITYEYGPVEIKLEVESRPWAEALPVSTPSNAGQYVMLQYADALHAHITASAMLVQAESITASSLESVFTQAGGVMRNQSTTANITRFDDDFMTKVESNVYFMDYNTRKDQKSKQEEIFRDGKYVVTVDDGVPTSQTGVDVEMVKEYCSRILTNHLIDPAFWLDATVTDMGSLYLIEYTYSEDFGNNTQNAISNMFWEDPGFLNKLASSYVNNETTGYLSVDKYTTLPVAAGFYFKGTHTIENQEYFMTFQSDQSIEAPGMGAYKEITEELRPEAEPETKPTPLFYHVTGDNGQEMWLLGTIHVGDERTAYLPQEIKDAFTASDALALECDTEAFDEQVEEDDDLQEQVSNYYYYSDGKTLESMMEEEEYSLAVKYMKATGNYNMNMPYAKPYLWSSSIDQFYLRQGYQLHRDQGVERRLYDWAQETDKEIREVESNLFQIEMLTGWSDDLQLLMLSDSMEASAQEYWEDTWDLYEKWCAGDEAVLREELSDEVDTSEMTEEELSEYEANKHLIDEYNKAMSYDRNDGMLEVAIEYLESGDVVFYAVGLAHLLNDVNGLVDALREAGYTVELVEFAQ